MKSTENTHAWISLPNIYHHKLWYIVSLLAFLLSLAILSHHLIISLFIIISYFISSSRY